MDPLIGDQIPKISSVLEGEDDDDDDLFASAMEPATRRDDVVSAASFVGSSGYDTENLNNDEVGIGRSDTLDDVSDAQVSNGSVSRGDDFSIFGSYRVPAASNDVGTGGDGGKGGEIREVPLNENEDEGSFENAHSKLQFQLSGGGETTAVNPGRSMIKTTDRSNLLEDEEEFIDVKVTSPHKVGEGMSSYMVYKVKTRTNVNYFNKKEMEVDRRFSDFLGLHDKLSEKYLQNGRIIPPAPDKSLVVMTKVKMSAAEAGGHHDEFVERRRAALERFLNRTACHSSLRSDPDFHEFLQLESELPRATQTAALSSRSVMKLISKVGDSLNNMTLKLEENDDWFQEKSHKIEQLDVQLKMLHLSAESLVDHRKGLAAATMSVSKSLAKLSESEDNSGLSSALAQLSNAQENISECHSRQANVEFFELSELLKDYVGMIGAVRDVFHERIKAWQGWQSVTSNLTKKREAKMKAELQHKQEKATLCGQEIVDLERQQEMAQENFDRVSRMIKKEVEVFEAKKAQEFKKTILKYLEAMLVAQDQIAEQWERYIPEVQRMGV